MKHIVTIGGGNGQSSLLRALREFPDVRISAIVSVMDSGGSSGRMRDEDGILPPGDIRRCFAALSNNPDLLAEWNARDENGDAAGNLVIRDAVLANDNDWIAALSQLAEQYDMPHVVLPVTLDPVHLVATLDNGQQLFSEDAIDSPDNDQSRHIQNIELDIPAQTLEEVRHAILTADLVVLSMGDLYTSLIPNLLVTGVTAALQDTNAELVYIVNRSTKPGETHGYSQSDFVEVVKSYLHPATLDHVIVDSQATPVPDGTEATAAAAIEKVNVITADLADPEKPAAVGGKAAATAIMKLCTS